MHLAEELAARRAAREGTERAAIPLPVPLPPPTEAEVAAHEVTHFPAKAWCVHCQQGKRRQVGHRSLFPDDKEKGGSLCRWTTCS